MTERTKKIKGLISGQVDMGTFGLVELELLAIENEMKELRQPLVSGSLPLNSMVIEVASAKAKEFHGGKSSFSAAYEEGWVDGAVWMRNKAEKQ